MPHLRVTSAAPTVGLTSVGPYAAYTITYNDASLTYNDASTRYDGQTSVASERYAQPTVGIRSAAPSVRLTTAAL